MFRKAACLLIFRIEATAIPSLEGPQLFCIKNFPKGLGLSLFHRHLQLQYLTHILYPRCGFKLAVYINAK